MNLEDFKVASFDPKGWINAATKNIENDGDKDKSIVSLIAKLQIYFHQLNGEFESTAQGVIQTLPMINRDAEKLSEDAALLQEKMNSVRKEIEGIKRNTSSTISSLERIDKVKMELVKYKNALHEADKWTMLSEDIKTALDVRDIDAVISKVITMQQSLDVLANAHDYEDKKLELESFKNQLEAMASPMLLQAFTSRSVEQSRKYVKVFQDINRLQQLVKLYSQNQKSLLIQSWDILSDMESEESVVDSFRNYYQMLISTWQEQIKWCEMVFTKGKGVEVLLDLYRDLCFVLSPKFSKHIENHLKQVPQPLMLLLDLKLCTQQFANSLKSLLSTAEVSPETLLPLAKSIYQPYKHHISKYGVYQEAALHPHLMSLDVMSNCSSGDLMEAVQSLGSQNSKVFSYLDEANKLCIRLTESCGYPGYLKAAECYLKGFLNQYRLMRKLIGENEKNQEELNLFQMCLTVLEYLGNFTNRLRLLERDCFQEINKVKMECSGSHLHPFSNYPKLLLDEMREAELATLLRNANSGTELQELKPVFEYTRDLCQDVYEATYKVIFEPITTTLNAVGSPGMWESKKGSTVSDLPDYGFVPQEYITQIGQYLMNLPQLLDPFSLSKNPELVLALSLVGSDYATLSDNSSDENAFAEIFLGQVARGTCKAYVKQILGIQELSPMAAKQLATDIQYLGNVFEDMGFSLTKKLQEIVLLLKLSPSEYGTQCSGCSPQIVAAIRQMRNIISG